VNHKNVSRFFYGSLCSTARTFDNLYFTMNMVAQQNTFIVAQSHFQFACY